MLNASSSGSPVTSRLENRTAELISASSVPSVVAGTSPRAIRPGDHGAENLALDVQDLLSERRLPVSGAVAAG